MPNNRLNELLAAGDLDAIDRISLPATHSAVVMSVDEIEELQELSYKNTNWYASDKIRKHLSSSYIYTTIFKNDNIYHPVACLEYSTATSNPNAVTITLYFRNNITARLPIRLAVKQFQISNPTSDVSPEIDVPNILCFENIEAESIVDFIGNLMLPLYFINGEPCEFGTLYFKHEHEKSIRELASFDYPVPLMYAVKIKSQLYESFRQCCFGEDADAQPRIDRIKASPHISL